MKYQGSMARMVSLTVLFAAIVSTLADEAIVSTLADEVIDESMSGVEYMTLLPGGIKLCSQSDSSRGKTFTLNDTAYIFINYTMYLSIESPCFKKKHFIKFVSNKRYSQVIPKSIMQIKFTTDGLVIDTKDDIEYSKMELTTINSEISNDVHCLKRSHIMKLDITEENKYSWFMDKCDLVFDRKNEIKYSCTLGTRYYINFPYIIILLMILIGKAICGFAIYKRRKARLITFTSSRLVEHYGNVSPLGRGNIIVAANGAGYPRQPSNQSDNIVKPSEDLPPAYNDLQQPTDINLPRYEETIKSPLLSPPEYEDSCRDNVGF